MSDLDDFKRLLTSAFKGYSHISPIVAKRFHARATCALQIDGCGSVWVFDNEDKILSIWTKQNLADICGKFNMDERLDDLLKKAHFKKYQKSVPDKEMKKNIQHALMRDAGLHNDPDTLFKESYQTIRRRWPE